MKKLLFLLLALVWLPACQAAPKLYWSENGTNGYWGGLQGTIGTSNATDLTEGTLPNARLSSAVLTNGASPTFGTVTASNLVATGSWGMSNLHAWAKTDVYTNLTFRATFCDNGGGVRWRCPLAVADEPTGCT